MSDAASGQTTYRIVVAGALDEDWSERTGGMAVRVLGVSDATTELVGPLADQAALMGVLQRLYAYGARILLLQCIPDPANGVRT